MGDSSQHAKSAGKIPYRSTYPLTTIIIIKKDYNFKTLDDPVALCILDTAWLRTVFCVLRCKNIYYSRHGKTMIYRINFRGRHVKAPGSIYISDEITSEITAVAEASDK